MKYKRMILEEGEGEDRTNGSEEQEEYVPGRGEAFAIGMTSGWASANKVMPIIGIAVILILIFVCN